MMNRSRWMFTTILLFVFCAAPLKAQEDPSQPEPYFHSREMPDLMKILPPPPDSIIHKFTYDVAQYQWGKEVRRDHVRDSIAKLDAEFSLRLIIQEFSEPFGLQISYEETPEIYKVLRDGTNTCDKITSIPKIRYMRRRPFMVFNEHTATPEYEPSLVRNGSFPSGHTVLGWSAALLLTEINPAAADTLMARGYMYGESRVIVGAHWQSDVDAGYLAASIAYAKLHTSDRFLEQMQKAKDEFKRLTGQTVAEPERRQPRAARRVSRQTARARAN